MRAAAPFSPNLNASAVSGRAWFLRSCSAIRCKRPCGASTGGRAEVHLTYHQGHSASGSRSAVAPACAVARSRQQMVMLSGAVRSEAAVKPASDAYCRRIHRQFYFRWSGSQKKGQASFALTSSDKLSLVDMR